MDLFELGVQQYIARDRGVFLAPQYLVGKRGKWEACPDFLAINFPDAKIWMVEVTKAPASKIRAKRAEFHEQYVPKIKEQLEGHRVIGADRNWRFGLWLFVPASAKTKLDPETNDEFWVTSLEEAIFPIDDAYRE